MAIYVFGQHPEAEFINVNNFVEVSGHNLEISQTGSFCMDFLNHRVGGMVFYHVFRLSPLQCTVTELQKLKHIESQGNAVEMMTVNKQGGKLLRLLSGFSPRIRPQCRDLYNMSSAYIDWQRKHIVKGSSTSHIQLQKLSKGDDSFLLFILIA